MTGEDGEERREERETGRGGVRTNTCVERKEQGDMIISEGPSNKSSLLSLSSSPESEKKKKPLSLPLPSLSSLSSSLLHNEVAVFISNSSLLSLLLFLFPPLPPSFPSPFSFSLFFAASSLSTRHRNSSVCSFFSSPLSSSSFRLSQLTGNSEYVVGVISTNGVTVNDVAAPESEGCEGEWDDCRSDGVMEDSKERAVL